MKANFIVCLLFTIIVVGCNLKPGSATEVVKSPNAEVQDSLLALDEPNKTKFSIIEKNVTEAEIAITKRDSLLPFFKDGVGYYIQKDTTITRRLIGPQNSPNIPFNTRVEVQEVLKQDAENKQKFFWVKLKGIDGKYPSFFFSNFKFPYTKDEYSLQREQKSGKISGGRTGLKINPPGTVDDIAIWQMDSLGWKNSKDFIGLSDFDGESGWILKGNRISTDSLSFNAAVQLFFHAAYLYDEGLKLQQNVICSDDVKIWYATFVLPPYNSSGFCRIIEREGYIQILAETESDSEENENFSFDKISSDIKKITSTGQFSEKEWSDWISGDDFFENSVFNQ